MAHDSIAVLIKRASLEMEKLANTLLIPQDLTNTQFKILIYLSHHKDLSITQKVIEDRFSMTNPTVTGIIQNLEKKGLVFRQPNPNDARSKVLGLTPKAQSLQKQLIATGRNIEAEFTRDLDSDQKETLKKLLKILVKEK